jgi:hypothetical protein
VVSSAASAAAAAASAASIVIGPGGVQEYSENLAGVAAISPTDGNFIVGNGTTIVAETGLTAQASLGLNTTRIATIAAGASVDLSGWSQVIVNRYSSGSPLVPSLYRQVSADPGHDGAWQDSVGTWFEYVPGPAGIDVRAFGATGDGVTDDTDAIQAAIDYADGLGGGVVFFPPGDYLVSASALVESFDNGGAAVDADEACIIQRSQVSLLGSGVGATKITVNDTGALTAIFSISPDGCFVRGMEIDGGWTQVSGSGHGIIQLQNTGPADEYCRDFSVENVYIHDCASYGIGLQNGDIENTVIRNVRIKTVGADGIDSKQRGPAQKNHGLTIDAVTVEDFGLRLDDQAGVDCHGRASLSNIHVKTFGRTGAVTTGIRLRTLSTPSTEGDNARGSSLTNFIVTGTGTGDTRGVLSGSPDVTIAQGFVEGVDIGVLLSGNANGVPDRNRIVNVTAADCGTYGFQVGASISYTLYADCVAEACDTGFINAAAFTVYANCFAPNSATAALSVTSTPLSTQTLIGVGLLGTENGITQNAASTQSILQAFGSATDIDFRIDAKNAGAVEFRSRGARAFRAASPASAVNWLAVNSSATGVAVELNAAGSDSNIDILYRPKGTGNTRFTTGLRSEGATHGIGYGTGAGGTVAQATSKSTGVTLSKACGQITMHSATLTAGTNVSFTLTNTAIAAGDLLVLNHVSGGTVGAYALNAQCGAGSAVINVRNLTAGNLGEAIVIGFALVKGVTA